MLHRAVAIIRQHKRAYVALNLTFYGLIALGMAVTALMPHLQDQLLASIDRALAEPGIMKKVADAYGNGDLLVAIVLTFVINVSVAIGLTTLPSMIVPFVGILAVLQRAFMWGIMFSPIRDDAATLIPHFLTILVEGQAYILAAFAAYVQGRMFLWPARYGLEGRRAGYKAGMVATGLMTVLVALTLFLVAIYEGFEVIYL